VTTREALESITDAGLFERVAAAVLREAAPETYSAISERGTNAAGKTVRSPADGIAFAYINSSRTLVLVAHASGALEKLDGKWFHEPQEPLQTSTAKQQSAEAQRKPRSADKGDLIKAREIAEGERLVNPNLAVRIALTTNREPSIELLSKIEQFATAHGYTIDVWSGSRIANVLDINPNGQWIRKTLLGIEADRASLPLLNDLGKRSLRDLPSHSKVAQAIEREFDDTLVSAQANGALFVVGESGSGKSTACQKILARHADSGRLALVLYDYQALNSVALEDAIDAELRRLHPTIEKDAGRRSLALATAADPVILLVEDVNKSPEPGRLIDRLVAWATKQASSKEGEQRPWRIICPLWPQSIRLSSDASQKFIESHVVYASAFARNEAVQVLIANARVAGHSASEIEASTVAEALGYDPLLIDLFEWNAHANPLNVVADYVKHAINRISESSNLATADEYSASLNEIGKFLLSKRLKRANWLDFRNSLPQDSQRISQIRALLKDRKIIQLPSSLDATTEIIFRHDQVEFHLLAQCLVKLHKDSRLDDQLVADPYYAHIFGQALLIEPFDQSFADKVYALNPLALFHAVSAFRAPPSGSRHVLSELAKKWLARSESQSRRNRRLRYAVLGQLRQLHDPLSIDLLRLIPDSSWVTDEIRFLNGDSQAGIRICAHAGAGVGHTRRDKLIAHVKQHYGAALLSKVDQVLQEPSVELEHKAGAIRLAGFIASTRLLEALTFAWKTEIERQELLSDYLFAAAHCSGENQSLLDSLCDFWATLPDSRADGMYSEREAVLVHDLKFACRRGLPEKTIEFFISRAQTSSLSKQIETLLGVVDHPLAVEATVTWRASRRRAAKEKGDTWIWRSLSEEWRGGFDQRRNMSLPSKQKLEELWSCKDHDGYLRREAFGVWAVAANTADLEKLRAITDDVVIADDVLRTRLELRDVAAIDGLIKKFQTPCNSYWWQHARGFKHPRLVAELDRQLEKGRPSAAQTIQTSDVHWILGEMVIRLDHVDATTLLTRHWDHLGEIPYFVQSALYFAVPETLSLAADSIKKSTSPRELLASIHMHFGIKTTNHPGVHDVSQVGALVPYLDLLDEMCVYMFWELCNEKRWYEFRQEHLDPRLNGQWRKSAEIESSYIAESLDALVENKRYDSAYHWAERQIEKYDSTRNLLAKVIDWSEKRGTIDSLEIAARVFEETATRADFDLIEQLRFEPASEANEIIEDAKFSVCMRSLV
jgi:hypothetical protein